MLSQLCSPRSIDSSNVYRCARQNLNMPRCIKYCSKMSIKKNIVKMTVVTKQQKKMETVKLSDVKSFFKANKFVL